MNYKYSFQRCVYKEVNKSLRHKEEKTQNMPVFIYKRYVSIEITREYVTVQLLLYKYTT